MSDLSMIDDADAEEYALWIDSYGKNNKKYFEELGQGPPHFSYLSWSYPLLSLSHYSNTFDKLILVRH